MKIKLGYKASAEQFGPGDIVRFGCLAEELGFESVFLSDHFQPWRHTGGHAPSSLVTLGALEFGTLLSGAVLTEQVFSIPGFGKMVVDAVFNRDYPVVQGVVLVTAFLFILLNLLADILYVLINPRLRRA